MAGKLVRFHLYRYQLLPISRHFTPHLFDDDTPKTMDELLARKNAIFAEALRKAEFKSARSEIVVKPLADRDDFFLFRIAANRSLSRETKEFTTEELDNWPKILVAIWNDPATQMVAIQERTAAFQQTKAVAAIIFEAVDDFLRQKQLTVAYEAIFEKQTFWNIVRRYEDRVREVVFEIITPNMANISRSLSEDLVTFAKNSNSIRNKIAIQADPSSALHLSESDETLQGLVDYSSLGGGNISLRIKNMKKRINTESDVKEVEIDELELVGDPAVIEQILRTLL